MLQYLLLYLSLTVKPKIAFNDSVFTFLFIFSSQQNHTYFWMLWYILLSLSVKSRIISILQYLLLFKVLEPTFVNAPFFTSPPLSGKNITLKAPVYTLFPISLLVEQKKISILQYILHSLCTPNLFLKLQYLIFYLSIEPKFGWGSILYFSPSCGKKYSQYSSINFSSS